jgi:hypothetical protein
VLAGRSHAHAFSQINEAPRRVKMAGASQGNIPLSLRAALLHLHSTRRSSVLLSWRRPWPNPLSSILLLPSRPHSPESSLRLSHPRRQQQRDAMPFPTPHVVRASGPPISSFKRSSPSPRLGRSMSQSVVVAGEWLRDGRACTCALRGRAQFTSAMRSSGARARRQRLTELLLWTCKKD